MKTPAPTPSPTLTPTPTPTPAPTPPTSAPTTAPTVRPLPVITIVGGNVVTFSSNAAGVEYHDQGAWCSDLFDGDLNSQVVVNTDVIDSSRYYDVPQYVVYQCSASDGTSATATRTVYVVPPSSHANVFTDPTSGVQYVVPTTTPTPAPTRTPTTHEEMIETYGIEVSGLMAEAPVSTLSPSLEVAAALGSAIVAAVVARRRLYTVDKHRLLPV